MSKVEQFLKGLEQITRNKFIDWEKTEDFIENNHNLELKKFINQDDKKKNIILDKSYTCNFYNNIVSLIFYKEKGYFIHIQSSLIKEVKDLKTDDEDLKIINNYIESILKYI